MDVRWPVAISSSCNELPHHHEISRTLGRVGTRGGGGGTSVRRGDPQVGCLATDWALAIINNITPQVVRNIWQHPTALRGADFFLLNIFLLNCLMVWPVFFNGFGCTGPTFLVSFNVMIWRDDSEDLRFIVLHAELWSQKGAFDVFCH